MFGDVVLMIRRMEEHTCGRAVLAENCLGKGKEMKSAILTILLVLVCCGGTCLADLVARYALDGSAGDAVGDNHGVEIGGPIYEAGAFGHALLFNGTGSYINCGNSPVFDMMGQMTVSAWVAIDDVWTDWMTVVAKGNSAWRLSTLENQQKFHFGITGGPGWHSADGVTDVPPGEWHHVCGTYDGGTIRLYVNGLLDGTKLYNGGITTNAFDVSIGENLEAPNRYWRGMIDDVQIYDHALSGQEVGELSDRGRATIYGHPGLTVAPAPSGPDWTTISSTFVNIEDIGNPPIRATHASMGGGLITDRDSGLKITFSAEAFTQDNKRVFVRALVDGESAEPSDVVFAAGGFTGTRSFTFTKNGVGGGGHWVQMQWLVDPGGTAHIGDTTLTLSAASGVTGQGNVTVRAAPSGPPVSTTVAGWTDVPDLQAWIGVGSPGNLAITVSGEAYTSAGKRMFVRALLDNQPASPADVIFATGGFTGTRSFTFTRSNVPPGDHSVRIQWLIDEGGTASIGDRTLTICSSPELTLHGGLTVEAAPSGPDKTTTFSGWSDMPNMSSSIATALDAKLDITFSGEVETSNGKRMFVRALVDGQPASPSDVVLTQGGYTGTRSFTFTKEDLTVGPHDVRIQWLVDAGGTAYVGDRTLTANHWRSQVPDLSKPFYSLKPTVGKRKLLVILWDPHRPDHPAPGKSTVQNVIFGSRPSVRDYFLENSGGRFTLESAGVFGWYAADKDADHYWNHPANCCADGFTSGHVEKWTEAIRKADPSFNYKAYDTNNDNVLSPDELGILIVIPQNDPFGTNRSAAGRQCPNWEPLMVDGVRIDVISEAYIGSPPSLGLVAHELAHLLLGAGDMYFWFFQPYAAGGYSLMDQSPPSPPHLDPFHKLRLGWIVPRVHTGIGWRGLPDVETNGEACILYDPLRGTKEYFVVENRWRGNSYDSTRPDVGLGVWHMLEDPAVFGPLPAPIGSPPAEWNKVGYHEWARRGIRMIRPVYGPPFNDGLALWDGSDPATGYDLLPFDSNPNHATLHWSDKTPSPFAITNISPAEPFMEALIESP